MKVDFKKLKKDISLPDFLLHLGWKFAPGSSPSAPKMTDGSQYIVIKKNNVGEYTYWDTHSDIRGASVIDLMQQHMFQQTGKMPSLREVGETLQLYINNNEVVISKNSDYKVSNASLDEKQLAFLQSQLKPYKNDFLEKRGISKDTLSSPEFRDVFFSREFKKEGKTYNNTCTKMINAHSFQGISQRGMRNEDNKSFKGVLGNKFSSITVSNHDKSRPIDTIYVGESMIDCASHYQLNNLNTSKNILYVSTEGSLTKGQLELIKLLIDKQNPKELITIFDNDGPGYKYTLKLDTFLKEGIIPEIDGLPAKELKEKVLQLSNVELSINNDWNDDLKEAVLIAKNIEFEEAVKKNDFSILTNLKMSGYVPSSDMMQKISAYISINMAIAIQKIFDLQLKGQSMDDIKLVHNESNELYTSLKQEL